MSPLMCADNPRDVTTDPVIVLRTRGTREKLNYLREVMQPGDLVIKCTPYVHVLSGSERNNICDECLNSSGRLLRCSACHVARFCSKRCQRRAWFIHKAECACLQRVAPRIPTDSVRLFFRILLKQQFDEHKEQTDEFLGVKRSFADLESHVEEIKRDAKRMKEFLQLCETLRVYVGCDWPMPCASELLQVFGKMVINSFSICDGEMQPIGVGIYLGASLMDHSCVPNAVAVFSGTELHVRNTIAIDISQRTKLFISYVDQLLPRSERRRQLNEQYYFTCDCPACTDDHQLVNRLARLYEEIVQWYNLKLEKMMMSVKCPTGGCNGAVLETKDGSFAQCRHCQRREFPVSFMSEKNELVTLSLETLQKVKQHKLNKDHEAVLETCESCLQRQQRLLHPHNIYVVQVTDCAFDAAINLSQWHTALDYGCRTLEPYRLYYPTHHPNIGVLQMKVGKIQLYLHQGREAMNSLADAEVIIQVTHGQSHLLYRELTQLLDQCAAELGS